MLKERRKTQTSALEKGGNFHKLRKQTKQTLFSDERVHSVEDETTHFFPIHTSV